MGFINIMTVSSLFIGYCSTNLKISVIYLHSVQYKHVVNILTVNLWYTVQAWGDVQSNQMALW